MNTANTITIFDTTLRDGEQSPGFSMTVEQKIEMAQQLEYLGVDVMEAGFPIASEGDWKSVNEISKTIKTVTIAGLARATEKDIDAAASAIQPAAQGRIHTFISTSDLHITHKLKTTRDDVIQTIFNSVGYARRFTNDIEWSAEDASRTDIDFLCRCVNTAIRAGATTVNLPDTVGYAEPDDYADMFMHVMNRVPNIDTITLSAHCHNDRGMAVANTLAAVKSGVRQVECTINGIGERAGNAALEEIVMAMRSRPDKYPYQTQIVTEQIMPISRCLERITGVGVQPNKAITGKNAFAHESGIHQDGVLKNRMTYEIMKPEDVGAESSLVIGKHSGKAAIGAKLSEMGFEGIDPKTMSAIYDSIMNHCDGYRHIDERTIRKIALPFVIS